MVKRIISSAKNLTTTQGIALVAMLIAIGIVLKAYVNFSLPFVRIETVFIPIGVAGIILGPIPAAIAGTISDVIGYFISVQQGGYFPGFTVSLAIMGFIYGIFLYPAANSGVKNSSKTTKSILLRIAISDLLVTIIVSCILNTLWLKLTMGDSFATVNLALRIGKSIAAYPLHILILFALYEAIIRAGVARKFYLNS